MVTVLIQFSQVQMFTFGFIESVSKYQLIRNKPPEVSGLRQCQFFSHSCEVQNTPCGRESNDLKHFEMKARNNE